MGIDNIQVDYYDTRFIVKTTVLKLSDDGLNWTAVGTLAREDLASVNVGGSHQFIWLEMAGYNPNTGYTPAILEVEKNAGAMSGLFKLPDRFKPQGPVKGAGLRRLEPVKDVGLRRPEPAKRIGQHHSER